MIFETFDAYVQSNLKNIKSSVFKGNYPKLSEGVKLS